MGLDLFQNFRSHFRLNSHLQMAIQLNIWKLELFACFFKCLYIPFDSLRFAIGYGTAFHFLFNSFVSPSNGSSHHWVRLIYLFIVIMQCSMCSTLTLWICCHIFPHPAKLDDRVLSFWPNYDLLLREAVRFGLQSIVFFYI